MHDTCLDVKVVTPGESLLQLPKHGKLRIGTGISVDDNQLVTNRCGVARQTKAGKVWIEGRQKRSASFDIHHLKHRQVRGAIEVHAFAKAFP